MPAQAALGHGIAYTVLKQQHIFLFMHINLDFVLFGPKSNSKLWTQYIIGWYIDAPGSSGCVVLDKLRAPHAISLNLSHIKLDLLSLFGLHAHSCTHWLRPRNSPNPLIWAHIRGRYWLANIVDISLWPPVLSYAVLSWPCNSILLAFTSLSPPPLLLGCCRFTHWVSRWKRYLCCRAVDLYPVASGTSWPGRIRIQNNFSGSESGYDLFDIKSASFLQIHTLKRSNSSLIIHK